MINIKRHREACMCHQWPWSNLGLLRYLSTLEGLLSSSYLGTCVQFAIWNVSVTWQAFITHTLEPTCSNSINSSPFADPQLVHEEYSKITWQPVALILASPTTKKDLRRNYFKSDTSPKMRAQLWDSVWSIHLAAKWIVETSLVTRYLIPGTSALVVVRFDNDFPHLMSDETKSV